MAQYIHKCSYYESTTGTSEDHRAALAGTMPISLKIAFLPPTSTPPVCSPWSGFLQKSCEIPGSGVVLYYFKAQSRINGEISLPQSINQKSSWLIRINMFFPCFTMLHRLFSNMKMSDKNVVVPCVLCQNCGIREKKRCLRGTVLWTELCGSFQMVVVRKWQARPFFASKNMVISALPRYKTVKRCGWENLCGQTEAAFAEVKREGNNFGFQILPVHSYFVLAVLITSSSMQWVLLTLCIWTVPSIMALHLPEGILPLNKGTARSK